MGTELDFQKLAGMQEPVIKQLDIESIARVQEAFLELGKTITRELKEFSDALSELTKEKTDGTD